MRPPTCDKYRSNCVMNFTDIFRCAGLHLGYQGKEGKVAMISYGRLEEQLKRINFHYKGWGRTEVTELDRKSVV